MYVISYCIIELFWLPYFNKHTTYKLRIFAVLFFVTCATDESETDDGKYASGRNRCVVALLLASKHARLWHAFLS